MANHILAVHIDGDELSLAIAESTLRSLRITSLVRAAPSSEILADVLASQRWDRVVASLPARSAFFRILDFPFHDRRRLAVAVGPALEDHIPASLDESTVVFDFTSSDRHSAVLAAMIADEAIQRHRAELETSHLTPERMLWAPTAVLGGYRRALGPDAEFTAIDIDYEGATVACLRCDRVTGMRVIARAADEVLLRNIVWSLRTLDPASERVVLGGARALELHARVAEALAGSPIETLPEACPVEITDRTTSWRRSTTAVGLVLAAGGNVDSPLIEVASQPRSDDTAASELRSAARRLAPWAAATLSLSLVAASFDYARLYSTGAGLQARADAIFERVMPPGSRGPGQRVKMDLRLQELERRQSELAGSAPSSSPLAVLADMSATVPHGLGIEFDTYTYDPPTVRLHGQGDSFEAVTRLQQALSASKRFHDVAVSDVRSSVSGDTVEFELSLRLAAERNAA